MNDYVTIFNDRFNFFFAIACQNMDVHSHDDIEVIYGHKTHTKVIEICRRLALNECMEDKEIDCETKNRIHDLFYPLIMEK